MSLQFEWDKIKAHSNKVKHDIEFEEAKTVFYDYFARVFDDILHSVVEQRFIMIGYSNKNRLLIVSYSERNDRIRIISARKVTKNERKLYEEFYKKK